MSLGSVSKPKYERLFDDAFRRTCYTLALLTVCLGIWIVSGIAFLALPAIRRFGLGFLISSSWNPSAAAYGILPEIWGTLYSSVLALLFAGLLGISTAIWLTQGFLPAKLEGFLKIVIDLLAAIPSVVYGLWGIYYVIPMLRPWAHWLHENFSWIPLFSTQFTGPGVLPAALVLGIMILPTVATVSRDALSAVPRRLKEAAFGLGATRWEVLLKVVLPTASRRIAAALVLGFGRAIGETMALAMLAGNFSRLTLSLLSPFNTLAARLANQFPEAGPEEASALMYAALVLIALSLSTNIVGITMTLRDKLSGRAESGAAQ
jgi:phosphate transport system permease protein